jgi:hypothetical protein
MGALILNNSALSKYCACASQHRSLLSMIHVFIGFLLVFKISSDGLNGRIYEVSLSDLLNEQMTKTASPTRSVPW